MTTAPSRSPRIRRPPRWLLWLFSLAWSLARRLADDTVRSLARLLFSKSWRRFEAAMAAPRATQEARLLDIVATNAATAFGRDHGFDQIHDVDEYRRRVPIRGYDQLAPYIERMVQGEANVLLADPVSFFARTSGTSGQPKYVPVTQRYIDEYRSSRRVWSRAVAQVMPGLIRGHFVTMHSPGIDGITPGGTPYGSITVAFAGGDEVDLDGPVEGISRAIYKVADVETRYYLILRAALDLDISFMGTINPSTLLLLCRRLTQWAEPLAHDVTTGEVHAPGPVPAEVLERMAWHLKPRPEVARRLRASLTAYGVVRPVDLWPRLCGVLCWKGGSAPFYLAQLKRYFADLPVMDYGYLATEGAFNVPLDAGDGRGPVALTGHFLEFVPEAQHGSPNATTLLVDELQQGERYALVVTGSHGLYRYDLNDIVEVVGCVRGVAEIRFLHKGGNMLSITGEKVGEAHAVQAMEQARAQAHLDVTGFLATVELGDPPRYAFAVETRDDGADTMTTLLRGLDDGLKRANIEYAAKRDSKRLGPPRLYLLPAGTCERMRQERVQAGAPEAHVKVPHLWRDPAVLAQRGAVARLTLDEDPT